MGETTNGHTILVVEPQRKRPGISRCKS